MLWLDVCGPPGVGKSTICDPLWDHHAIGWDGLLPPASWQPFLDEVTRLFDLIRDHWSFVPAVRMNRRSIRKMATVSRMPAVVEDAECDTRPKPYIQTGLVQRGLGFGWRLNQMGANLDEIRPFFELMPVSLGVAVLKADVETIQARNRARLEKPETAHENRAFMVPLMEKPRDIAVEVLRGRGVPVIELDTTWNTDATRDALVQFAAARAAQSPPDGHSSEGTVLQAPQWWG